MNKLTSLLFSLVLLTSTALFAQDASEATPATSPADSPSYHICTYRTVDVSIDSSKLPTEKIEVTMHLDDMLRVNFSPWYHAGNEQNNSNYIYFNKELNSTMNFLAYAGSDEYSNSHLPGDVKIPSSCGYNDSYVDKYYYNQSQSFSFVPQGAGVQEVIFSYWVVYPPIHCEGKTVLESVTLNVTIVP